MNYVKAADKNVFNKSKVEYQELEDKIFERLFSSHYFKEIRYPFAVLEKNEDLIILGSSNEIAGKISYNYTLLNALTELVGVISGNKFIKVEVRTDETKFLATNKRIANKQSRQIEEQNIADQIEEQKNLGQCNLIPFPIKENKIRSDLTIERHAIFAANTFKGNFRVYEREIRDQETGKNFILRIEVGDRSGQVRGILKQRHQEVFYKLSQIWSQQNYQIEGGKNLHGSLELTVYDLVKRLRGDDAGHHYQNVMQLLKEMATIRVNIKKINVVDDTYDCQDFTILSYEWYAKLFDEKTLRPKKGGISKVKIRFSEFITNNFLRKNVKSLMMDSYLSLKDRGRKGIAQLLYTMLDYELSTKEKFNISLVKLSERLGLTKYPYKSKRKEKFEGTIKAVNEANILDGNYKLNTCLIESEDRKDWILVARRIAISNEG